MPHHSTSCFVASPSFGRSLFFVLRILCGCISRFYNGSGMLHAFGTGLQYNDWTITSIRTSRTQLSASTIDALYAATPAGAIDQASSSVPPILTVSCEAEHTGEFDHSSIPILLYARSPRAGQDGQPLRSLVGFERVAAGKGEPVRVRMHTKTNQAKPRQTFEQ